MKVEISHQISEILLSLSSSAGIGPDEIVGRLLGGHVAELYEYQRLLDRSQGDPEAFDAAVNLLVSYGPEPLMTGIKRVAPSHQTYEDSFASRQLGVKLAR